MIKISQLSDYSHKRIFEYQSMGSDKSLVSSFQRQNKSFQIQANKSEKHLIICLEMETEETIKM